MRSLSTLLPLSLGLLLSTGFACSDGSESTAEPAQASPQESGDSTPANSQAPDSASEQSDEGSTETSNVEGATSSLLPENDTITGEEADSDEEVASTYAVFEDPDSDFSTVNVYDATRELFHFDAVVPAMVNDETGDRHSGWLVEGLQLGPNNGSFGNYQIRFGTEFGERRAYFTEFNPPTICNLTLSGPEELSISRTSEEPPTE